MSEPDPEPSRDLAPMCGAAGIERWHCQQLAAGRFCADYSRVDGAGDRRAVVIDGLTGDWGARGSWGSDCLRERYGGCSVEVSDDEEATVGADDEATLPLGRVLDCIAGGASSPYVFEPDFAKALPGLVDDYAVPTGYFDDDVLHLLGAVEPTALAEEEASTLQPEDSSDFGAPDYQWFLLGGLGSGSEVHQDPPHMSSWNACVLGCKRWAFIDPSCPATAAEIRGCGAEPTHSQEAAVPMPAEQWFRTVLPALFAKYPEHVREFLQPAGTLVYFPPFVWHAVLNVGEYNAAVTQSYIARRDFDMVLDKARGLHAAACEGAGVDGMAVVPQSVAALVDKEFGFESIPRTRAWIAAVEASVI